MKPSFVLGLAACAVGLCAAPAFGQVGVVLGGVADAAARVVRNSGLDSASSLVSGSNATSRIIVRGSEDLGDGWSAGFHLEHGLVLDSGSAASATQFWDRRSTLSLTSRRFGELRLGRDFVPSYLAWSRFDPFSYVGVAGSNNLVSATPVGPIRSAFGTSPNTTVRSSNAAQWLLPGGLGGLEGGVMVAAGEGGAAANGQHKVVGARIGWAQGPFVAALASTRSKNNLTGGEAFDDTAVGASYGFGGVRVSAAWRRYEQAAAKQSNTLLGLVVPLGAAEIKASWVRADLAGRVGSVAIDGNDADQFGLGAVYNLSRRTALYATWSRIDNDGAASFVVPGGAAGLAGGGSSSGVEAGIRHTF